MYKYVCVCVYIRVYYIYLFRYIYLLYTETPDLFEVTKMVYQIQDGCMGENRDIVP